MSYGVWEDAIVGYLPLHPAQIDPDLLVLTALDTRCSNLFNGTPVVSPGDALGRSDDDSPIKGQVVVDPFSKAGPALPGRNIDTQIQVAFWEPGDTSLLGNRSLMGGRSSLEVTLNVGPDRVEEVGAEFGMLLAKLKDKTLYPVITKVQLSAKLEGKLDFDQSTAQRVVGTWSGNVKLSLEADLKIPKTDISFHVEATLGVDQSGKVVPGIQVSWDF